MTDDAQVFVGFVLLVATWAGYFVSTWERPMPTPPSVSHNLGGM